jgi:6-pyruvoyltetrahydropterin/6-carboxytetrahydropterin synthase
MNTKIYKDFTFESAHKLPHVPDGHKCGRLHGHSYKVRLHFVGCANNLNGWFIDFSDIKKDFKPLLELLDHNYLNDIDGLENPTAENLAKWIFTRVSKGSKYIYQVEVMETCTCGAIYPHKP